MLADQQRTSIRQRIPHIAEDVPLAAFSTLRIGGPARFLLRATTTAQFIDAVRACRELAIPFAVLGAGANTLIADRGYDGVVIVVQTTGLRFDGQRVLAEAGVKLSVLLVLAASKGLGGLDVLAGIPGTVGGAVVGNAGGRDQAIGTFVESVDVLTERGIRTALPSEACEFRYRMSRFKRTKDIVLGATLVLEPGDPQALQRQYQTLIREKNKKQPTADQSAGCIFKNVEFDDLSAVPADLRSAISGRQLSAWRVIDATGLRGKRIGGIRISERHANFMVNDGTATADDVAILISYVKQQVRDRFGVELHEEVRYLGFGA